MRIPQNAAWMVNRSNSAIVTTKVTRAPKVYLVEKAAAMLR